MAAEYRRPRSGRAPAVAKDRDRAFARHRERIASRHSVKTAEALVRMVDEFGFCFAFTGESAYPIPAAFDHLDTRSDGRKWEWMWGWKDELAEKKRLYYGKLLVKKPTFVSMKMLPIFYATFGRGGDADDHLEDVRAGRLSEIARRIIEFLAVNGETQTKRRSEERRVGSDWSSDVCSSDLSSPRRSVSTTESFSSRSRRSFR